MRKFEAINFNKLTVGDWNIFLSGCLAQKDVTKLSRAMYSIQAGMDDLVKKKMNTEENNVKFVRLQKSIELTLKRILKLKYPSPLDDARKIYIIGDRARDLKAKRARDAEFEKFLRSASY